MKEPTLLLQKTFWFVGVCLSQQLLIILQHEIYDSISGMTQLYFL